jgi:hypothetical protein
MISQIFLAFENYSYVGVITNIEANSITPRYGVS